MTMNLSCALKWMYLPLILRICWNQCVMCVSKFKIFFYRLPICVESAHFSEHTSPNKVIWYRTSIWWNEMASETSAISYWQWALHRVNNDWHEETTANCHIRSMYCVFEMFWPTYNIFSRTTASETRTAFYFHISEALSRMHVMRYLS